VGRADSFQHVPPPGLHVVNHHAHADSPRVVLVHGAPDRSKSFAHVVHRLPDLAVTVYDRRGYGKSLDAAKGSDGSFAGGFAVHAGDLIAILDGTPSIVVGQSAGGTIAMLAATKAPELFLALGLWEPPMIPWDLWDGTDGYERTMTWGRYDDPQALGETFNRQMLGDARWDALRPSTQQMLRDEGAAFRADMACQAEPFLDLDALKPPIVLGCGTVAEGPEWLRAHHLVADRIGAELFVAEGADHFAHTGAAEAWVELVRRTVARA
jgi:pimeloyl-ACP methyl ester carboxylesterase